jgi:hypothetical protein
MSATTYTPTTRPAFQSAARAAPAGRLWPAMTLAAVLVVMLALSFVGPSHGLRSFCHATQVGQTQTVCAVRYSQFGQQARQVWASSVQNTRDDVTQGKRTVTDARTGMSRMVAGGAQVNLP